MVGYVGQRAAMISAIANSADISEAAAGRAAGAMVNWMQRELLKGAQVHIRSFGTFYVVQLPRKVVRGGVTNRTLARLDYLVTNSATIKFRPHLHTLSLMRPNRVVQPIAGV